MDNRHNAVCIQMAIAEHYDCESSADEIEAEIQNMWRGETRTVNAFNKDGINQTVSIFLSKHGQYMIATPVYIVRT